MWQELLHQILASDEKALARAISLIENEEDGYEDFLKELPVSNKAIIGVTGPPGAGKSTLVDAMIGEYEKAGSKTCVLCVDPSSPFSFGALLGDRIRMSSWYNSKTVFIRSLATRGSLGGLHPKILEIADLVKAAGFSQVIIETVGVGQSEVEIAGLADTTIVVLVPESGDEIQAMKSGLMEIADIFVVNKSDRPGADKLVRDLHLMLPKGREVPVLKMIASEKTGIEQLMETLKRDKGAYELTDHKRRLMADRAYNLLREKKMTGISREILFCDLQKLPGLNLYKFIDRYL